MKHKYTYGEDISSEYPGISIRLERITPETAEKMLEANTRNRGMKREPIAKAIVNGEWGINGATIVFSDEGVLLDGQNRLNACIKSGTAIETIVVRGVKKSSQLTMDCGIKRQVSDHLKILGYKNSNNVAAVGLSLKKLDECGIATCFYKAGHEQTIVSVVEFIEQNKDRVLFIHDKTRIITGKYRGVANGTIASLLDRFYSIDEECAEDFVMQLARLKQPTQPVEKLQSILLDNSMRTERKLTQKYIAAVTIKAWNAYMRGEEIKQLKFATGGARPETFPQICETCE